MKTILLDNHSKSKVEAFKECLDFCENGYFIRFWNIDGDKWFIKMSHYNKPDVIIIKADSSSYSIKHNGKNVKEYSVAAVSV